MARTLHFAVLFFDSMFDQNLLIGISLVLVWTCFDLRRLYLTPTSRNETQEDIRIVPSPTIETPPITTVKIRYCSTCGYRNAFEQFSELIRQGYPNISIVGEHHPPPPLKALLAKGLSLIKMALLICLLFGLNPFVLFRISTPRIYHWALQNKMYACLMIFFFSNSLESYLVSTYAFEISVNDIPVWSKLETHRLPSTDEFIQIIQPFA